MISMTTIKPPLLIFVLKEGDEEFEEWMNDSHRSLKPCHEVLMRFTIRSKLDLSYVEQNSGNIATANLVQFCNFMGSNVSVKTA